MLQFMGSQNVGHDSATEQKQEIILRKINQVKKKNIIWYHSPTSTTEEKTLHMDITRWPILKSDWSLQPKMEKLLQSAKTRLGAKCDSDYEHLIDKFRLKLKKVGKTTGPFRYDLNQIPYDYTVEVGNRCKGLDLIQSAWRTTDRGSWHCTGDREQDHPQEKEMHKSKIAVWGGLTNSCEKKRNEKQRRKGKIYPFECRVPKNRKER